MALIQADEPTDAELVRQAMEQKAAFAALYRRYLTPVYRYFYVRTGDVQQAEDLTAQTFISAMEGLPRYREQGTFAGWLFTIAARRLADHFRRRRPTSVPFISGRVAEVNQRVEAAGVAVCLERVVVTPSETRAYLRFEPSGGVETRWTPIALLKAPGDGDEESESYFAYSGNDDPPLHQYGFLAPLYERQGEWTLTVTELVGTDLSKQPEAARRGCAAGRPVGVPLRRPVISSSPSVHFQNCPAWR